MSGSLSVLPAATGITAARNRVASFARGLRRVARDLLLVTSAVLTSTGLAVAEDRTLKLLFTHTGERAAITYKRDGKWDNKGLAQVNRLLRDWRRNESTKMDPRLLDLAWEVYQRSGAKDYIHVVSAYRSPATNNMLRGRSRKSGVAKNSQHSLGKAMDFFIPGVKIATLRKLAMQMQIGGVGYYPTSGSPFVHLDVGSVRAWPRMSRRELAQIFPNGKTLHLPSDGRPLPGYDGALADYKRRVGAKSIEIAATAGGRNTRRATASGEGLLTAMLPTPRSRGQEALAEQFDGRTTSDTVLSDLARLTIPRPSPRPVETTTTPAQANLRQADPWLKSSHDMPRPGGVLLPAPSTSSLSARGLSDEAEEWSVSHDALMAWALLPSEELRGLALPRMLHPARDGKLAVDRRDNELRSVSDRFDTARFSSDG